MRHFLPILLLPFLGMKPEEKQAIRYRSFYAEMKRLEPKRVTAFSNVNTASNNSTFNVASLNITVTSTTAGNLLVLFIQLGGTGSTVNTVTDNQGNTYAKTSAVDNGLIRTYMAYGIQTTGGTTTVTVSLSGVNTTIRAIVNEYSGFSAGSTNTTAYDTWANGTGSSTSISTSAMSPSAAGELIVGGIYAAAGSISAGSGYTQYGTSGTTTAMQHKLSGTTSETCPATCSSGNWIVIALAFKDIPAGNKGGFFYFLNQ